MLDSFTLSAVWAPLTFISLFWNLHRKKRISEAARLLHAAFGGQFSAQKSHITHTFRYREHDFTIHILLSGGGHISITTYAKLTDMNFEIKPKNLLRLILAHLRLYSPSADYPNHPFYIYGNIPENLKFQLNDPEIVRLLNDRFGNSYDTITFDKSGITIAQTANYTTLRNQLLDTTLVKTNLEHLLQLCAKLQPR
ncbi:MAG: hypothetical protein GX410_06395 [Elusimicrobia bacterium]|nr:hypothetical protein [Elusimicrobiota bacterium]